MCDKQGADKIQVDIIKSPLIIVWKFYCKAEKVLMMMMIKRDKKKTKF